MSVQTRTQVLLFLPLVLLAAPAEAYMGPGAGLGMLGSLLAISALGFATLTGLLLYPLTLLRNRLRRTPESTGDDQATGSDDAPADQPQDRAKRDSDG